MVKVWNEVLGLGMLNAAYEGDEMVLTFASTDGKESRFKATAIAVGPPKFLTCSVRKMPKHTDEDRMWRSYRLASGATMAFRFDGPPPA